jgi:hypothetical protein
MAANWMRHVFARQNYPLGITSVSCYRWTQPTEYEYPTGSPQSHVRRIPPSQLVGLSLSSALGTCASCVLCILVTTKYTASGREKKACPEPVSPAPCLLLAPASFSPCLAPMAARMRSRGTSQGVFLRAIDTVFVQVNP